MKREDAERLVDEAWKRALQPGWYVATKGDEVQCIHLRGSGLQQGDIMAGWTLGPSVAELLRDAARYREALAALAIIAGGDGDAQVIAGQTLRRCDAAEFADLWK